MDAHMVNCTTIHYICAFFSSCWQACSKSICCLQNVKCLVKDHIKGVTSIHCSPDDKQFASGRYACLHIIQPATMLCWLVPTCTHAESISFITSHIQVLTVA